MSDNPTPIAIVRGESVSELPKDLYIPPEALEVILETFEGPLDLLLYLIRRQNLDILEVKVAEVTAQYMQYIDMMQTLQLELAGEYLLMAAMLAEIKSRMLLPRPDAFEEDEGDPRAELIRRLLEYEQIKTAAENIAEIPRLERDVYTAAASKPELVKQHADPEVDLKDVLFALAQVLRRAEMFSSHEVVAETLSVRDRMNVILSRVGKQEDFVPFFELFKAEEGRMGVVVSFLAIMELVRETLLEFVQAEPYAPIHVRAVQGAVNRAPVFHTTYAGDDSAEDVVTEEE
ncbi:MAG: segregation/condensation protein A [Gammaproteobacteria bacterium]|nr:segregation/condensation protein A [Gammaproteobacteria bacterium]